MLRLPRPSNQLVEVVWMDAVQRDYDGPPRDAPTEMTEMRTAGYFVRKSPREMVVASDCSPEFGTFRTTHIIPRIHIKQVIALVPNPFQR